MKMRTFDVYVVNKNDASDKTLLGNRPEHRLDRFLDALEGRFNDEYEVVVEEVEK
jgi:DNA-binding protein Fis